MISSDREQEVFKKFRKQKIMTVVRLQGLLECSVPTVRNRLKRWKTYTSYNHNGRFYVLSDVPRFDEHGLWEYQGARFSRSGTLKQTVIELIALAPQGLTAGELGTLLGMNPRSFMNHYVNLPQLRREKLAGLYVYLSTDEQIGHTQLTQRKEAQQQQSLQQVSDHDALWVFADFIRDPQAPLEQRVRRLRKKGLAVNTRQIESLLKMHGLSEKKTVKQDI